MAAVVKFYFFGMGIDYDGGGWLVLTVAIRIFSGGCG